MISTLIVSTLLGAGPGVGEYVQEVRRAFIEDGVDRVSATTTHRVISHSDGSLELQGAQPVRLSLQSITRASMTCQTMMLSRLAILDAPNTVRSLRSCEVEESWTNSPIGLEHAFTILRAPPGTGGLSLFVRVDGPWHHADDDGHVFKGPGAGASLRYGRAFVVRGQQRLPIEVVHVEGGLELRVPAALADAPGAFPMEIDPLLSAEVPLDSVTSYGPSPGRDETPAIAMNNQGTAMVVWADDRRQFGADLFGARITAAGALGDPVGIPINSSPGHQVRPTICADGANFLVAWELGLPDGGIEIRARPVTSGGTPGQEFLVTNGAYPALAAGGDGGTNYLAFVDPAGNAQVIPIRGTTRGPLIFRNTMGGENAARPAIAASNFYWFVAYETGFGVTSIRGMESVPGGANVVTVFDNTGTTPARRPSVALASVGSASAAEDAFVTWELGANVTRLARVSTLTSTLYSGYSGWSPALARTSYAPNVLPTLGSFVPSGTSAGAALQLRNLNDGGISRVDVGPVPNDLVMVGNGQRAVAAWTESPRAERDVYGAALGSSASATPAFIVSRAANSQRGARVAIVDDRNEGLAVWIDGPTTIYGAKVQETVNGLRVGSRFHLYTSQQTLLEVDVAAVANAGGGDATFLVAWRHAGAAAMGQGLMGQLTTTSSVVDSPFVISSGGVNAGPAVAWDEGAQLFQVAWNQASELQTRSVDESATLGVQTRRAAGQANGLALGCFRSTCLLAWGKPTNDLSAVLFGNSAAPPLMLAAPAGSPAIAHDGTDFYLAWHSASGISLARVDAVSGAVANIAGRIPFEPNAAVTGLRMASATPPVLVWSELTNSEVATVYMQRVDLQDPAIRVGQGFNAAVAIGSPNTTPTGIVVYQRYQATAVNAMRVFGAGFTFVPDAGYLDAGVDLDAGTPDAGVDGGVDGGVDAGADAGVDGGQVMMGTDAGFDAGVSGDGGVFLFETSGCSCQSSTGAPLVLLFAIFLRRRRQHRDS